MREVTDYLDSFLPPFARLSQPPSAHSHHHHHHHHHIHHLATADASASANTASTGVTSNAPVQYLYHGHLTGPSHLNSSPNSVSPANSAGGHQQVSSHTQHNSQSVVNSSVAGSNTPTNPPPTAGAMGAPVDAVSNAATVSTTASSSSSSSSSSSQPIGLLSAPSGGPPACNSSAPYTNSYFAIVDVFQEQSKPLGTVYCYNCGQSGHLGNVCSEKTLDDLTKSSKYYLSTQEW